MATYYSPIIVLPGNGELDISVTSPLATDSEPCVISGQCTDGATVTLSAAGVTFTSITYDRSKTPLNDWSCEVDYLKVGANVITVTCSE